MSDAIRKQFEEIEQLRIELDRMTKDRDACLRKIDELSVLIGRRALYSNSELIEKLTEGKKIVADAMAEKDLRIDELLSDLEKVKHESRGAHQAAGLLAEEVGFNAAGNRWISVQDRPLMLPDEGDTWEITKEGSEPFLAFITVRKNGLPHDFMAWCYIPEGTIDLYYVGDDEATGWMAIDVEQYIPFPLPTIEP